MDNEEKSKNNNKRKEKEIKIPRKVVVEDNNKILIETKSNKLRKRLNEDKTIKTKKAKSIGQ